MAGVRGFGGRTAEARAYEGIGDLHAASGDGAGAVSRAVELDRRIAATAVVADH